MILTRTETVTALHRMAKRFEKHRNDEVMSRLPVFNTKRRLSIFNIQIMRIRFTRKTI